MITSHFTPGSKSAAPRRSGRSIRLACAGVLLAGSLGAGMASCAEPEATFYITEAKQGTPTVNAMGGGFSVTCQTIGTNIAQVFIGTCNGVPDPSGQVAACFGVRSELVPAASQTRIESRSIVLTETDTTLVGSSGVDLGGKFAASGIVDPMDPATLPIDTVVGLSFGKGSNYQTFLSEGTAQGSIILHGRTTGNLNLETPRFDFEAEVVAVEHCKQ